eukprot:COSAG05_NODE_10419_length_566_cov_1.089936_1_plen_96_part_00
MCCTQRTERAFLELAKRRKLNAGSTSCVVVLHGRDPLALTLVCANVGDSRAVLCRGGRAQRLSEDHKPNRRDERKRIEKAGGCVLNVGGVRRRPP